jgi:phosphoribosylglycinamide formyltransferase 1
VHFVIPETDAGPIVMQGAVAVRDDDTSETLAARILEVEHRIYPAALSLLATGKIRIEGDVCKTVGSSASENFLIAPVAN